MMNVLSRVMDVLQYAYRRTERGTMMKKYDIGEN